jgi:type II secretory pathway pseudopilin PulG
MKNLIFKKSNNQTGQTLIETLAAAFILVMGIASAVGLSVYSLNTSSLISKQIVGVGLAREALEAVKNMRDTNWLNDTIDTNCYNYVTGGNDEKCYKKWLKPGGSGVNYTIEEPSGADKETRLSFDPSTNNFWQYKNDKNDQNGKWGLDLDTDVNSSSFKGFYSISNINNGVQNGSSDYYRKIILTEETSQPYDQTNFQRLKVTVRVWWTDRRCPRTSVWPGEGRCGIQMDTYLTNWKNY